MLKHFSKSRFFLSTLVIVVLAACNYWYVVATYKPAYHAFGLMEISRDKGAIRESSERALASRSEGIDINALLKSNKNLETKTDALYVLANIQSVRFFEEKLLDYFRLELETTGAQDSIFNILGMLIGPNVPEDAYKEVSVRSNSLQKAHKRYWEMMKIRLNSHNHIEIRSLGPTEKKSYQMIEKLVEVFNNYYMQIKLDQLLENLDDLNPIIGSNENIEISKFLNDVKFSSTYQLAMVALFDSEILEYIRKPEPDKGYRAVEVDFRYLLIQSFLFPFFGVLLIFRLFVVIFK